MVQEAFLRMYVETVGHYGDCIATQQDSRSVFQVGGFLCACFSSFIIQFPVSCKLFSADQVQKLSKTPVLAWHNQQLFCVIEEWSNAFKSKFTITKKGLISIFRDPCYKGLL